MKRFPNRTLVLMLLALLAFGFMWLNSRPRQGAPPRVGMTTVEIVTAPAPSAGEAAAQPLPPGT